MRRIAATFIATVAFSGTLVVLPVYASPGDAPEPVVTETEEIAMGSVDDPAPTVDVQPGVSESVAGVPGDAPTLTLTRSDVDEFSLVGVTWAFDPGVTDTLVQVRVMDADGEWGSWTEVGTEEDTPSGRVPTGMTQRGGTSPLWTGPSTGVEVELVTRSGSRPTDVQLDLVDPGKSPADAAVATTEVQDSANAAMAMPIVKSRAQWGADESLRTWAPRYASTIKAATLHHTADSDDYSATQVPAVLRSIYRYHAVSLGWGDIGYNVIVDKFGKIWEGRSGGLASTVIGAHAGGFNNATFGVSMLGNYDIAQPTEEMVDSVARITAWKLSLFDVDPVGRTTLTSSGGGTSKYAAGVQVTLPTIFGHRDVGSTACPGRHLYAKLPDIRARVDSMMTWNQSFIADRYYGSPTLQRTLGDPVGGEQQVDGVWWQDYARGALYWSQAGGTRLVMGAIRSKYLAAGGPQVLGAPNTDETALPDGVGRVSEFAKASILWSPATGANFVRGAIRSAWETAGGVGGPLRYPVSDELVLPDGVGRVGHFQGGSIYWSPGTGARVVWGAVGGAYTSVGGSSGPLGYPVTAETELSGNAGRVQRFQGGLITWSAPTGAHVVWGAVLSTWTATGQHTGFLGLPVADEQTLPDGRGKVARFQGGSVYWSPASGAQPVGGAIAGAWTATGSVSGPLGYPTTGELPVAGGGRLQRFQGGVTVWSRATGAHVLWGAVLAGWTASGGVSGPAGYPTSHEAVSPVAGGRTQTFQNATYYWSPATGAHAVAGATLAAYRSVGAERGRLGFPTGGARPVGSSVETPFQGGRISVTSGLSPTIAYTP